MPRLRCVGVFLLLEIMSVAGAYAQSSGVIQGTVVDQQGKSISGARVTCIDDEKKVVVRDTVSETDGSFRIPSLTPGKYTVKVGNAGFKTSQREGIVLDVSQVLNLGPLTLQVGNVSDVVTVNTDTPLVETATGQKDYVLSERQVTQLAVNGRDITSLLETLPGVTSSNQSDVNIGFGGTGGFNVNGNRSSSNNVTLDGSNNTDQGDNGAQYTQLSLDAVGEFKLQTNVFNAEYGRNPGVLVSIVTKGGGQQYHGTLFEFFRNTVLDANSFFRNRQGQARPILRLNQFGGNFGGPVPLGGAFKNKLFFFFNEEAVRFSRPNGNPFVDVPNAASLTGDFRSSLTGKAIATAPTFDLGTVFQPGSITRNGAGQITGGTPVGTGCTVTFPAPNSPNCNVIPASAFNQNAPAFVKILNEANRAQGTPTPNSFGLTRVPLNDTYMLRKHQEVARIDYLINPSTSFFFRWVNDAQHEQNGLGLFSGQPLPVFPYEREKPGSSMSWNLLKVISPTMTNEVIFYRDKQTQIVSVVSGTDPATFDRVSLGFKFQQLFPASNILNRFPQFNCAVGSCNFGAFGSPWTNAGWDYGATDNFTMVHGAHTFKTGIYFNLDDKQQQPAWNDNGNFDFSPSQFNPQDTNNGLANLLLGNFTTFSQANGKFLGQFRFIGVEFYGQDSWKVNHKLTLELGARYVYLGPTYTRGQFLEGYFSPALYNSTQAVNFDINNPNPNFRTRILNQTGTNPFNGIVTENSGGVPLGFAQHRKNQVSPRIGFAYDVFGDGKTSLRGGFGTFFERIRQNVNSFDALGNPPLTFTPTFGAANIDSLAPALVANGIRTAVDVRGFDQQGKIPTTYAWSLDLQRQIGAANSFDIGYAGNSSHHLQLARNINQLPLGTTTGPNNPLPAANNVKQQVLPFRGYNQALFTGYDGNSSYNALQARFTRRFAKGLTGNVAYTYSKAIDQSDADDNFGGCGFFLNCAREKGPAGFDRTHVFSFDYVYDLPKVGTKLGNHAIGRKVLDGWELAGITRFWSGLPISILSGTGNPGTLGGGVRADLIPGQSLYVKSGLQYLNPLAFAYPANGTLGNSGRNIARGPGVNNWNVSLYKNTTITERVTLQFRAEAYNVFNHTQFFGLDGDLGGNGKGNNSHISGGNPSSPVTALTAGTTGQFANTRDPRQLQLALKLFF